MASSYTPMLLSRSTQEALVTYLRSVYDQQHLNWNMRDKLRRIDLSYMREEDQSQEHWRAKISNRLGDRTKFQNITVPVVLPAVESAVTYQTSVFLTGNPIFGVVSNPQNMDAALQMETVIDNQATRGGWTRELMLLFRDGVKYNFGALEVSWERQVTAAFETDLSFSTKEARPKEVVYEGNCIRRLDPYNIIFDNRVEPTRIPQDGEFAGYTRLMSRIQLKAFLESLPDKMIDNIVPAFEAGLGYSGYSSQDPYYIPDLNPDALVDKTPLNGTNWMSWAALSGAESKIQYRDMYQVTTLYARILPSDFSMKVPARNTPQVWKFIFVNNSVLIYAERQTNAHGLIPILFTQPLEDGLGYQTKSLADNVEPIQSFTSALWNSAVAARRKAIFDRVIYDPSRISSEHVNSDNPAAKIPVRPNAYGKPVGEAYYPIPFRDDQSSVAIQETDILVKMANLITGQNPARQGQFVKGNKTLHEFQSVMANASGRDQMMSILLEAQLMRPLKEIIKLNILQYQGGVSLFNRNLETQVDVDPVALRKAVIEFKISDGLTPSDKLVNADTLQVAMQVIGSSPQLAQAYNLAPLFSYFIKTQGGRISEFEKSPEQLQYEQALASWQSAVSQIAEALKGADPATQKELLSQIPPQPQPPTAQNGNENGSNISPAQTQ